MIINDLQNNLRRFLRRLFRKTLILSDGYSSAGPDRHPAQADIRLGGHAHLYFQPELSWYLTKTDLVTYRTDHPLGLTLHAGLRFEL